jgi:transcriptional regulator with XRE-family HTH domain
VDPYGRPAEWLARVAGVDLSTARRWKRAGQVPPRYRLLLELAAGADLGAINPAWRGWRFDADELVNPEGERIRVNQVRATRMQAQLAAELERQLKRVLESVPRREPRELVIRVRLDEDLDFEATIPATARISA